MTALRSVALYWTANTVAFLLMLAFPNVGGQVVWGWIPAGVLAWVVLMAVMTLLYVWLAYSVDPLTVRRGAAGRRGGK